MSIICSHIAGVKFQVGAADILAEMDLSAELELRPEPENKYDPNAVAIYYQENNVGYVPGFLASKVCKLIEEDRIDVVLKNEGQNIEIHYNSGEENDE